MPVLIITPDMTAETWDGATGWARGSQTWNGMAPAFVAKPTQTRTRAMLRVASDRPGAAACQAAKSSCPPAAPARIANATRIAAVATWVRARYTFPAETTARVGRNPTTRKAESSVIDSQASRNEKALLAPRTSKMLARKSG